MLCGIDLNPLEILSYGSTCVELVGCLYRPEIELCKSRTDIEFGGQ